MKQGIISNQKDHPEALSLLTLREEKQNIAAFMTANDTITRQ